MNLKMTWGALRRALLLTVLIVAALAVILPAAAQERTVTDDEVNAIARKLYCPVCENIPLDVCGTAACADWRAEIRDQLGSGMTEEEVISDFVRRFGDRVVGTPQDPTLRALSLVTPWVLGLIAVLGAVYTFMRWRSAPTQRPAAGGGVPESSTKDEDFYRARLEQDLTQRR
jgi:cytochrome c-type biogenesis protein CcmH